MGVREGKGGKEEKQDRKNVERGNNNTELKLSNFRYHRNFF